MQRCHVYSNYFTKWADETAANTHANTGLPTCFPSQSVASPVALCCFDTRLYAEVNRCCIVKHTGIKGEGRQKGEGIAAKAVTYSRTQRCICVVSRPSSHCILCVCVWLKCVCVYQDGRVVTLCGLYVFLAGFCSQSCPLLAPRCLPSDGASRAAVNSPLPPAVLRLLWPKSKKKSAISQSHWETSQVPSDYSFYLSFFFLSSLSFHVMRIIEEVVENLNQTVMSLKHWNNKIVYELVKVRTW